MGNLFDEISKILYTITLYNRRLIIALSLTSVTIATVCFLGCFWKSDAFLDIIFPIRLLIPVLEQVPILGDIAIVAVGIACGPLGPVCSAAAAGEISGFETGSVGEGFKAFAISLGEAVAFNSVGNFTGWHGATLDDVIDRPINFLENVAGHAAVGCAFTAASGGGCGAGATGAAFGAFVSPAAAELQGPLGLVATSAAGGVGSILGGGKFQDGAVTAAFGYLYNESASQAQVSAWAGAYNDSITESQPSVRDAFGGFLKSWVAVDMLILGGADAAEAEAGGSVLARCFPSGTKVSTPKGDINIENVKTGDFVYSYYAKSGKVNQRRVVKLIHNCSYRWIEIRVMSEAIRTTRNHMFWIENEKRWVVASKIKPDMVFRLENGNKTMVSGVSNLKMKKAEATYNLEIDKDDDYFVGNSHVLVHNGDGSYTITFQSGMQHVGKGDASRAADSAARISAQFNDPVVSTEWSPVDGTDDSWVQEEMRMRSASGPSGNTYNQINSPGNNIAAKAGCP